jgi:hypothetical protein
MTYTRTISFFLTSLSILLLAIIFAPDASAQQPTCPNGTGRAIQMMVGVPGLPPDGCARTLPEYINDFYLFLITVGAIVGVVKIGLAGFKYATSDIISSKSEAKQDIQGVFLGLIILLIPFLVLNAISPNAANLDVLKLKRIGENADGTQSGSYNNAAQNQQGPNSPPEACFVLPAPSPILMSGTNPDEQLAFKRACFANDGVVRFRQTGAGVQAECCG